MKGLTHFFFNVLRNKFIITYNFFNVEISFLFLFFLERVKLGSVCAKSKSNVIYVDFNF